jgi:hypothetical protein
MAIKFKERSVDELIDHFWKNGYMTLSRRYGKYLPSPKNVGDFEIDAVAKYKRRIAVGVTLTAEELDDPKIYKRLNFLATYKSGYGNKKVTLFVGVPEEHMNKARVIVSYLDSTAKRNIKLIPISN